MNGVSRNAGGSLWASPPENILELNRIDLALGGAAYTVRQPQTTTTMRNYEIIKAELATAQIDYEMCDAENQWSAMGQRVARLKEELKNHPDHKAKLELDQESYRAARYWVACLVRTVDNHPEYANLKGLVHRVETAVKNTGKEIF